MQTVSGDIVLLHATQANTRAALGEIIDRFKERGFDCVTVDELFARMGKVMETGRNYKYAL